MKRKIISLLLCLVMALSLIPTVAFGATAETVDHIDVLLAFKIPGSDDPITFTSEEAKANGDGIWCSGPMLNGEGGLLNEGITFENIYSNKYTPTPKPTTPAKPVTSVKTGDMGVALYAGLAILSMTGSAGVILRRRKNDK